MCTCKLTFCTEKGCKNPASWFEDAEPRTVFVCDDCYREKYCDLEEAGEIPMMGDICTGKGCGEDCLIGDCECGDCTFGDDEE